MQNGLQLLNDNKPTLAQLVLVNMPIGTTNEEAQRVALKEISNFEMLAQLKPDLLACTPMSVLLAVKQCICDNLTLAPSAGLVYLVPSRVKTGQNGNQDIYEWVLTYDPTANGRLSMAYETGSILDNERPVVTFDHEGKVDSVSVKFLVPSYPNPRWEPIIFNKTHFKKWMDASAKKNKGNPNANYTSWNGGIDPEFAGTKAIRHGLNKRGTNLNSRRKFSVDQNNIKFQPIESALTEAYEEAKHEDVTNYIHTGTPVVNEPVNNSINVNPNDLA